ncbi:MAG: DUF6502 family protein [Woeseiaceae bacterium]|nr:DUF6502 family protein [Woeseiaceae bacterium]
MKTAIEEGAWQRCDYEKLDLLVSRFFRILRVCGVQEDELTESFRKVLEAKPEISLAREINAPADLHLASTDLVFCWRRSLPFIDSKGRAKKLHVSGSEDSFDELVRRAAPQIDASMVLSYLKQLGAVQQDDNGYVVLSSDSVLACSAGQSKAISRSTVLTHIQAFLSSVEYNLLDRYGPRSPRFERACYGKIPGRLVPILERLIEVRGQNFIDSIDEWLARHSTSEDDVQAVWLAGAGAYVFAHPSNIFEAID